MYLSVGPGIMPRHCCGNMPARMLVVMRDRRSGRIRGVRTDDGRVIYRPKHGLEGVIANVEVVIDHHVRVNVHVRP